MSERQPAEAFSLAELLCDEMQERGWTTTDVAIRMGGDVNHMTRNNLIVDLIMIVSAQKGGLLIEDRTFAELAQAFGVSEQLFRNLHAAWRATPPERRNPFTPPESIFGPISRRAIVASPPSGDV